MAGTKIFIPHTRRQGQPGAHLPGVLQKTGQVVEAVVAPRVEGHEGGRQQLAGNLASRVQVNLEGGYPPIHKSLQVLELHVIVASQRGLGRGLVVPKMDQAGAELQVVPASHPVRHLLKLVLVLGAAVAVAAGGQYQRSHRTADFIPGNDEGGKTSWRLGRSPLKETIENQAGFGQEIARPESRQVDRHGLIPQTKGPIQQGGIGLIHGCQPDMILKGITGVQDRSGTDAGVNPRGPEVGVLRRAGAGVHRPGTRRRGECRQGNKACPDLGPAGSSERTDGPGADIRIGEVGGQRKALEDGIGPG